jgi:precorrin-2 dehydrogenase/sirohydrochlorin ferrochelatase
MPSPSHPLYPIFLDLKGCPVLVVGGGEVALRKVSTLLECGACVSVISPEFHPDLLALLKGHKPRSQVSILKRKFQLGDLKKHWKLVLAATHDTDLNTQIAQGCRKRNLPVNVAAPPDAGDFHVPASVRNGLLCVAISTGGASAALAKTLRQKIERAVGPEWAILAELLNERRAIILRKVVDVKVRVQLLKKLGQARWARMIVKEGRVATACALDAEIEKNEL